MSIFRDTLYPYVQEQLKTRSDVVSTTGVRDSIFTSYVSAKNGWVRMSSFVDYNDPSPNKLYSGNQLAQKYILEGGTLYRSGNNESLRFGLGSANSVYASNIDAFNAAGQAPKKSSPSYNDFRQLGIRPMPGIASANVVNKSAYGSLREATIKFYAWDKHQLEELEILYMRTGYTVLLEWGWSKYLESISMIKDIGQGINIFQNNLSETVIYDTIETLRKKYKGNYDAMLGHVKNFSWSLMPNGGYECSTVLISRGEIISTLRLSSNVIEDNSNASLNETLPLSTFERIFLNYKVLLSEAEVNQEETDKIKAAAPADRQTTRDKTRLEFKPSLDPENNVIDNPVSLTTAQNFAKELEAKIRSIDKFYFYSYNSSRSVLSGNDVYDEYFKSYGFSMLCDAGAEDGTTIEYIRLDKLLIILNAFFNLKDKNKIIAKIFIPKYLPCLANSDSVSIDPKICLIQNPNATFITNTDLTDNSGFLPLTIASTSFSNGGLTVVTSTGTLFNYHLADVNANATISNDRKYSYGCIDNIYISINKILEIYRSKGGNNPDGVLIIDFLKDLMSQVSFALGGINDFQLFTDKDEIKIIDVKYLEIEKNNKYEFDLLGLKSICRDVKITSRIFESQSTMIAIAAQNRNNIGDIYSSTQARFNEGLKDRLISEKIIDNTPEADSVNGDPVLNYYISLWNTISNIAYYLKEKCTGIKNVNGIGSIKAPTGEEANNASSLAKTLYYKINGKEVDYKAIIPFELTITLDGISGLVQGQIFTIKKDILPKDYASKNLGFIITGVDHDLQNNDWTTTIRTQVCLLDQDALANKSLNQTQKEKIKKNIKIIRAQAKKNQFLAYCITDFLYDKINNIFSYAIILPPSKTHNIGIDYLAKNGKIGSKINQANFSTYMINWFDNVKTNQTTLYNSVDRDGNKIFPQTYQELSTFSLNGQNQVLFNENLVDNAFSLYSNYTPQPPENVLFFKDYMIKYQPLTQFGNRESIATYFSLQDPYEASSNNFQTPSLVKNNTGLAHRITNFNDDYYQEFQGNIIYTNSIFGRGLTGDIKIRKGLNAATVAGNFNLNDQGNNQGLDVRAQSKNIDVSNYKTGEKFFIRSRTSGFTGKTSQIERYLSERFLSISQYNLSFEKNELWNKIFEYVTKDFLNPSSGALRDETPNAKNAFKANNLLLSEINGTIKSIYNLTGMVL